MWVIHPIGFYSVVQDSNDPTRLVVRVRVRADLQRLKRLIPDLRIIKSEPHRDYPYRAFVTRREWASALAQLAAELDYTNVKDEVHDRQGGERAGVYAGVWSRLLDLEPTRRLAWWRGAAFDVG